MQEHPAPNLSMPEGASMPNEVIVVFREPQPEAQVAILESASPLNQVLSRFSASLELVLERPSAAPSDLEAPGVPQASAENAEIARYYQISVAESAAEGLATHLRDVGQIETVYVKPAVESPLAPFCDDALELPATPLFPALGPIPYFRPPQSYLDVLRGGDAAAWHLSNGRGADVRTIDSEGGWQLTHVDLHQNLGGRVGRTAIHDVNCATMARPYWARCRATTTGSALSGSPPTQLFWPSRTTGPGRPARSSSPPRGCAPAASCCSRCIDPDHTSASMPVTISRATSRSSGSPDDFLAITRVRSTGILVVEAAGNGAQDLDDPLYSTTAAGFLPPGATRSACLPPPAPSQTGSSFAPASQRIGNRPESACNAACLGARLLMP